MNSMCAAFSVLALSFSYSANADVALPTGGAYVAGTGAIATTGNVMNINQNTQNGIINWGGFSIGSENIVNINNGSGATLNRVTGGSVSNINGLLNATGSAYVINRNGIVVGNTGVINTGGDAVLSTQDISNNKFMAGETGAFSGSATGNITNNGQVNAGGKAVFIGAGVSNIGQIGATDVEITATNSNPYAVAINNSGTIRATGNLVSEGGRLVLKAPSSTVQNSGTLDASSVNGKGGQVIVTGRDVRLTSTSNIDASGKTGGGNIYIGGGDSGNNPNIQNAKTTLLEGQVKANSTDGNGGRVIVWSDDETQVNGAIEATGKNGGGFVEVSSAKNIRLENNFWTGLKLSGGELLIDPANINIVNGAVSSNSSSAIAASNTIKDADIENVLNSNISLTINTAARAGNDVGDITVANDVSVAWNTARQLTLRANRDITLAGTFDGSASNSAATFRADAGRNINLGNNLVIKSGSTGSIFLNAAATGITESATDNSVDVASNWKTGTGAISHGNNVTLQSGAIVLKSGKAVDGTRTDIGSELKLNSTNGTTFRSLQLSGFDDVNVNANDHSNIETTSGSIIINAKNITIDEDVIGKGSVYLTAASFNDVTNNFVDLDANDPINSITDTRDEFRSDGWKNNHGTLTFSGDVVLAMCCGFTATSGKDSNGNRADFTSTNATFEYNNSYDIVEWFEVKGFNSFNTTIEGNSLNSNSFIDIRNKNNVINYHLVAGQDIPNSTEFPSGSPADDFGYVRVMGGVFNSNNNYSDNIQNIGTTTFDNSLLGGSPLLISAAKEVILTSGNNTSTGRTSITDETDTEVDDTTSYAGRTDNVKFAHTDDNGQFDGNVRIEGFREISLDTSGIGDELTATGNINTWSSEMTNINDDLTATNITSISEGDIYLRNDSTLTASNIATLVVDEKAPKRTVFGSNEGIFVSGVNTNINAREIAIFTSRQPLNTIEGQMNGQNFIPGLQYLNTAREAWQTFYSDNVAKPRNPFVIYYKDIGQPPVIFSRPDCASNPDANGCESFVQSPDDRREYRINLTQKDSSVGEAVLLEGDSDDVRLTEHFITDQPTYVDYRLLTAEKIKYFARAFPLQVVGSTLEGLNVIPGFAGVALALNGITGGIGDVVFGGTRQ